jgi:indole-3-glycerol phosphate synthase
VLTDHLYFGGSGNDLRTARAAVNLPVLRKDFIISEYQIYESRAMGADAVLLICRILPPSRCRELLALSRELKMDALVEVHTEADLDTVLSIDARLVGINNRNLASFETDIRTAAALTSRLRPSQIPVAASGIQSRADIELNLKAGIFNFLVGESLVRTNNPAPLLAALQGLPVSAMETLPHGGKP